MELSNLADAGTNRKLKRVQLSALRRLDWDYQIIALILVQLLRSRGGFRATCTVVFERKRSNVSEALPSRCVLGWTLLILQHLRITHKRNLGIGIQDKVVCCTVRLVSSSNRVYRFLPLQPRTDPPWTAS